VTDDKWELLREQIQRKFGIEARTENEPVDEVATREVIVFRTPAGKMKLERVTRPLVLDKRIHFSKRAESARSVEYVYSKTEKTHRETLFRWAGTAWEEIDLGLISR
jgi:dephospho-CoA kinase